MDESKNGLHQDIPCAVLADCCIVSCFSVMKSASTYEKPISYVCIREIRDHVDDEDGVPPS